nr:YihY/virulence factor BrkB family protein [Ornithinimicrobium sediminis]
MAGVSTTRTDPPTSDASPDLKNAFKRAVQQFTRDGGPDLAAALTYFAVLSLFPAILALTSLLGLFADSEEVITNLLQIGSDLGAPDSALTQVEDFITSTGQSGGAGIALLVGVGAALFSASNYVNAFTRAMNRIYGVEEGRPVWKLRPWTYLVTVVLVVGVLAVAIALVLSGGIAEAVGNVVGLGSTAVTVWNIAKWPVVVLIVMLLVAFLYWATPNVRPKFRILSYGAAFAIVVWALATVAFGLYLGSGLASYNATYGALAGVIIMLLWLWITNIVLVLGGELDAELERSRQLQAGIAAEEQIQLPLRDTRKVEKNHEKEREQRQEMRRVRMEAGTGRSDED